MLVRLLSFFVFMLLYNVGLCQMMHEKGSHVRWKPFTFYTSKKGFSSLTGECGIYSTRQDREAGTLSLAIRCSEERHRMKTGFLRDKSAIKIVRNHETYRYRTSELYGYRDCSGQEYHFYEGTRYELVNPGEPVSIYRTYDWVGKQRATRYFFATHSFDSIQPLTLENLRNDFSGNTQFLQKLQLLARNDFELIKCLHAINLVIKDTLHGI